VIDVRRGKKRRTDQKGRLRRARFLPTRTCARSGKYCFPDRRAAQRALRDAAEGRRMAAIALGDPNASRRHEQRAYKCPHCGSWHLTSRPFAAG